MQEENGSSSSRDFTVVSQSVSQSNSRLIVSQFIIRLSISQSAVNDLSVGQLVSQSVTLTVSRRSVVSQSVGLHSVCQSVSQYGSLSFCLPVSQLSVRQSIIQSGVSRKSATQSSISHTVSQLLVNQSVVEQAVGQQSFCYLGSSYKQCLFVQRHHLRHCHYRYFSNHCGRSNT